MEFPCQCFLGGQPGLPGSQNNADMLIAELATDSLHPFQPGIVGFHDYIQQDQCDIGMSRNDLKVFLRGAGMQ